MNVHAQWMIRTHKKLQYEPEIIIEGFTSTVIAKAVWDAQGSELIPANDDSNAASGDWEEE